MTNRPEDEIQRRLRLDGDDDPMSGDEPFEEAEEPAPRRTRLPRRTPLADFEDDWEDDGPAAPVVTDHGVYGSLPEPRQRLRDIEERHRAPREQWTRVATGVLALALAAWLVLFSFSQSTSPQVALPAIERVVESLTGLEGLLELHAEDIRAATSDPITVPGFEAEGITLSRSEVQSGDVEDWHASLLRRTAEAIYEQGPGILANGSEQTGAGTFSTAGGARLLMGQLSETNHQRASLLLWPLGIAVLAAAAVVLAFGTAFGRFTSAGFAMLLGALPAIVVGGLGLALVTFIGSDGSRLAQETHNLANDLVGTPLRNGVTLFVMSLAVLIPARIAGAVFARSRPREQAYDPAFD